MRKNSYSHSNVHSGIANQSDPNPHVSAEGVRTGAPRNGPNINTYLAGANKPAPTRSELTTGDMLKRGAGRSLLGKEGL